MRPSLVTNSLDLTRSDLSPWCHKLRCEVKRKNFSTVNPSVACLFVCLLKFVVVDDVEKRRFSTVISLFFQDMT